MRWATAALLMVLMLIAFDACRSRNRVTPRRARETHRSAMVRPPTSPSPRIANVKAAR